MNFRALRPNAGAIADTLVRPPNQYSIPFSLLSETRGNWVEGAGNTT